MERVVLVDEAGRVLGTEEKLAAHRHGGRLHLAFSVFVVDGGGNTLLQRRSTRKHHFGGLWSNSCCSHPRPDEDVVAAGVRRLVEEMGLRVPLGDVGTFLYRAEDPASGLVEHELDHVLVGGHDGDPTPNPAEVDGWRWVSIDALAADVTARPERYTPWLSPALSLVSR
jgi:isopentenyl-diphosphate delta-isomerase